MKKIQTHWQMEQNRQERAAELAESIMCITDSLSPPLTLPFSCVLRASYVSLAMTSARSLMACWSIIAQNGDFCSFTTRNTMILRGSTIRELGSHWRMN